MDGRVVDIILAELRDIKADVKEIRQEMTTLKVKVALFSSLISSAATLLIDSLIRK